MNFFKRLYSFDADVDFRKGWRIAFVISALLLVIGVFSLATNGLKLGIDFKGGTAWQFPANNTSVNAIRDALDPIGGGDATIQTLTLGSKVTLRVEVGTAVNVDKAATAMAKASHQSVDTINANRNEVGPSWGRDVSQKALRALIVFFIAVAIYISWQLEWRMAVGAILAVIHDVFLSVAVYAIFQFEVTPGTVVAFLTILGYSLYDTIVVYDKVKDNQGRLSPNGDMTYTEMMNLSLNQTFMRSINTTLSAVLPVIAILVIGAGILGAVTLEEFGLALLVGMIAGAYSSVFIASPIVAQLKEREPRYTQIRERVLARRAGSGATAVVAGAPAEAAGSAIVEEDATDDGRSSQVKVAAKSDANGKTITSPYSSKHPPRPRKQGKKR
jgi:preprotein translocase subunit SecF